MKNEPSPATKPFRARSNVPFFAGLAVLSGVYILLIVGMLLAEVLFLYPPNRLILLAPKGNPQQITGLQDLKDENLRIGMGDPESSEIGKPTTELLQLAWLEDEVANKKRAMPITFAREQSELVTKLSTGLLDVSVITEEALNSDYLALIVADGNPKNIAGLADLKRKDLRIGMGFPGKTAFGKQGQRLLQQQGLWKQVTLSNPRMASFLKSHFALQPPAPSGWPLIAIVYQINAELNQRPLQRPPVTFALAAQTLVDRVKDGALDVVLVPPRNVTMDAGRVQTTVRFEKVILDTSSYPEHASAILYPLWWVQVKLWALLEPLRHEEIQYALYLSLISCSITTILSLWVAVPFGYLMSRFNFFGKSFIDAILDIPIVLPPLVIGLALLILFQTDLGQFFERDITFPMWSISRGLYWQIGIPITYAVPSVIIAQFAVACAFAVRTMRVSFDQINPRQEQVALTLGCSRGQAFWKVVLPEARRGMITAATLAWARSLGEFGPILVFSGSTRMRTEVLPTTVFLELSVGNIETAVAVSLLMVIAAAIVLVIVRVFGMEKTPMHVK